MRKMNIRKQYITLSLALAAGLGLTSCNDFLDKLPDSRMEIDNVEKAQKVLVSAYATSHPAYYLEMYSDNSDQYDVTGWTAANRFQGEAWSWADATDISSDESPMSLWERHYAAISAANEALEYVNRVSQPSSQENAVKGEALLARAYNVFMLTTIFCNSYDASTASKELGVPYPEHTQRVINEYYSRGTLAETYAKIEADILEGLSLIKEYSPEKPKFHFTYNSGCAFAARFYLYYQKYDEAVAYATNVLGSEPAAKLRDWTSYASLSSNGQIQPNAFVDANNKANLLLETVYSEWGVIGGPYSYGDQYAHGSLVSSTETLQAAGPWGASGSSNFNYEVWYNNSLSKYIFRKVPYSFEYEDIQAGTGYAHSEYSVLNTDLLLLERAEAYALQGNYEAAIADVNAELSKFGSNNQSVSLEKIKNFYNSIEYYTPTEPTPKKKFNTSFAIDGKDQEPVLHCILQLKRMLTLHEGVRMQDVKRYGITIYRRVLNSNQKVIAVTDSLLPNDPRRAIQLPKDVITAGLEANPRTK